MQLVYAPTLPPGCCFICRASIRDSYVDTGISLDYDGAFYICNMCLGEMAKLYAYLSFDEYKELRISNEELQAQNYELIKRLGDLEKIHDALASAGYRLTDDGNVVVRGGYATKIAESGAAEFFSAEDSVGIGEGETAESLHDEGMDELHSNEQSASDFSLDL
jgi:hypothetical protein